MPGIPNEIFKAQIFPTYIYSPQDDKTKRWVVKGKDVQQNEFTATAFQHSAIQHLQLNQWGEVFIQTKPDNRGGQFINIVQDPAIQQQAPAGSAPPPPTQQIPPPPQQNTGAIPQSTLGGQPQAPRASQPNQGASYKRDPDQIMRGEAGIIASNIIAGGPDAMKMFNIVAPFDFYQLWEFIFNAINTGDFQDDPFDQVSAAPEAPAPTTEG